MAPKIQKIAGSSGEGSSTGVRMPSLPVPVQFVWPYGGRTVFLAGSFTGWRQIQMFPMERCPTSFQVLCPVMPGIHQYKFYVDGECHHDINAPQTSWNNEIVNTIVITLPPITKGKKFGPGMFNETFNSMDIRVPKTDIDVFHDWISDLLSDHIAYDMMPQSSKVITLDINMPVKQAFHILYEELKKHGSILIEEELETYTISAWKQEKWKLHGQTVRHPLIHVRVLCSHDIM